MSNIESNTDIQLFDDNNFLSEFLKDLLINYDK